MNKHFCNCPDTACPLHPVAHSEGCDPCIEKNLKKGAMPTCFFLWVSPDIGELTEYSIDSFVNFYLKHKKS